MQFFLLQEMLTTVLQSDFLTASTPSQTHTHTHKEGKYT